MEEKLVENYGIKLDGSFRITRGNKLRFYRDPGFEVPRAERYGIYLGEIKEDGIRLNVYSASWLGRLAEKNVIEISRDEFCRFLRGERMERPLDPGYYIIKYERDYVGCVRSNGRELIAFLPKEFRASLKRLCEDR